MTSLDGYSLNEKMDKEFKEINKQIKLLRSRIESEIKEINKRFTALTMAAKNTPMKLKEKAEA